MKKTKRILTVVAISVFIVSIISFFTKGAIRVINMM